MKGHKTLAAIAAVFAVAMFISCNNLTLNGVNTGSASDRNVKQMAKLSAKIVNYADFNYIPEGSSARTILPDTPEDLKTASYKYYLYGTTTTGKAIGNNSDGLVALNVTGSGCNWKVEDTTKVATFDKTIDPGIWTFILYAIPSSATFPPATATDIDEEYIQGNAVLWAHAYADMERSAGTVQFTLTPDGLKGKGQVGFHIYTSNNKANPNSTATGDPWYVPSETKSVKAEIRNRVTGEVIKTPEDTSQSIFASTGSATDVFIPQDSGGGGGSNHATYKATAIELNPGTYNFVVTFTLEYETDKPIEYVYTETLVVISGRISNSTVVIPNIIGTPPAAPENFKAYYIVGSEDDVAHEGYYTAVFQWTDKSTNEKYFEIWLGDVTGRLGAASLVTTPKTNPSGDSWYKGLLIGATDDAKYGLTAFADKERTGVETGYSGASYNQVDGYSTPQRWGGSVLANSTEYGIYLPLGRSYQARIRAVNDVAKTEWVDCVIEIPSSLTAADGSVLAGFVEDTETGPFINRYRIKYDLQGGWYEPSGGGDETNLHKVEWHTYTEESNAAKAIGLWSAENASNEIILHQGIKPSGLGPTDPDPRDPFRFWVLDLNAYRTGGTQDAKTIVYDAGATSPATKMRDLKIGAVYDKPSDFTSTGYKGQENQTLYAVYTGSFNGEVTYIDYAKYDVDPAWISYTSSGVAAGTGAMAFAVDRNDVVLSNQVLTFKLEIPTNGVPEIYDTASLRVDLSNGQSAVPASLVTDLAFGTAKEIGIVDISALSSGTYQVIVECVKANGGNPIIRSTTMTMTIKN